MIYTKLSPISEFLQHYIWEKIYNLVEELQVFMLLSWHCGKQVVSPEV